MALQLYPVLLEISLWDILKNLKPVPLAVIALLVLFSLLSWTIVFSKWGLFNKARRDNRSFLRAFRKSSNLQAVALASEQFAAAPMVAVFDFGYGEVERQIKQRGALVNKLSIERSLQLGISEEITKLERNMNWLATVASVSPFIGLFGTVWGIMDAFVGLGNAGSASLRAVAPGIAESLVTTALGLVAAIPAAIFYNVLELRYVSSARVWKTSPSNFRTLRNGISAARWRFRLTTAEEERRGRRFGNLSSMSEINIVPLVDVVLVLLIIFMITANVMEFGLDIKVPEVRITRDSSQELPVVNITKSGELFLNNNPVNANELAQTIRSEVSRTECRLRSC